MDDKEEKKSFYYEVPEEDINKAAAIINKLDENYKSVKVTATHTENDSPYYITQEEVYKGPWPAIVNHTYDGSTDYDFTINMYTIQDNLITIETVAPNKEWVDQYFLAKNNEFKIETSFCVFNNCNLFEYSGLNVTFRCKKTECFNKSYLPFKDLDLTVPKLAMFDIPPLKLKGNEVNDNKATVQAKLDNIKGSIECTVTNQDVFDWSFHEISDYNVDECKVEVVTLPKSLRILKHNNSPNLIFNLTSFKKVYYPGSHTRIAEIFLYIELNKPNYNFIIYFSDSPISLYNIDIYFRECRLAAYNQHKTKLVFTCKRVEDLGSNHFLETEDNKVDILKEIVKQKEPANDLLVDLIDV